MKKHSLADVMTELHGEESKKYYSYQNVARRDPQTGRARMHRSKVDHCLVSRALLDCNAVLAAGISARAGVGNSLHFAIYVELDFGCALGIERTNVDAADIVDMEPRMPYIRNMKRRDQYSKTIMDGLNQLAVPDKTAGTRKLVQAYMQARDKAEVLHGKDAGRVHGRDRRAQMKDGQVVDRLTGKPWMATNVGEDSAQMDAAEEVEHLKEECMESMRRVMESVEEVFATERASQVGKAKGNRRDGWSVKSARVITRVRDMIAAAHKTVGTVGATLLRNIGVVNRMASKLEISVDCSKMGEREAARAVKKAGKQLLSGIQGRHRKKWRSEMGKRTRNVDRHRQLGKYKRYINSALMRDNGKGLSPWLVVEEEEAGEGGAAETVRKVVEGADEHKAYKASWMERWMSRDGLEQ